MVTVRNAVTSFRLLEQIWRTSKFEIRSSIFRYCGRSELVEFSSLTVANHLITLIKIMSIGCKQKR